MRAARCELLDKTSSKTHKCAAPCTHKQTGSQQPLALADTLAISTVSLVWLHAFHSKRRIIYIICVFPKWCEQAALSVGFLLANVSNWPWEKKKKIHPQTQGCCIYNGPFTCFFGGFFFRESIRVRPALMHRRVSLRVSTADASAPAGRLLYVLILICACA